MRALSWMKQKATGCLPLDKKLTTDIDTFQRKSVSLSPDVKNKFGYCEVNNLITAWL